MSVRIEWAPSTETDLDHYVVNSGSSPTGSFTFLANVSYNLTGPNFDQVKGVFFYVDAGGTTSTYYTLAAVDTGGTSSLPSQPFQAAGVPPAIPNTVMVNENYGGTDALIYQDDAGNPIEGALIRAFTKTSYDAGDTNVALAVTTTNALGRFVAPIFLTTGYTYTLVFAKQTYYGPDAIEIIV